MNDYVDQDAVALKLSDGKGDKSITVTIGRQGLSAGLLDREIHVPQVCMLYDCRKQAKTTMTLFELSFDITELAGWNEERPHRGRRAYM